MKVAIVGAGFTAVEADALRRAMATFKFTGEVSHFSEKLVEGMVSRGHARLGHFEVTGRARACSVAVASRNVGYGR